MRPRICIFTFNLLPIPDYSRRTKEHCRTTVAANRGPAATRHGREAEEKCVFAAELAFFTFNLIPIPNYILSQDEGALQDYCRGPPALVSRPPPLTQTPPAMRPKPCTGSPTAGRPSSSDANPSGCAA